MRKSSGHTLIEATVAMSIAMIVAIATMHVFRGGDAKVHATDSGHTHAAALKNHTEASNA